MNATAQWESLGFSLGEVEAGAKNLADLNKDWLKSPPTGHGGEIDSWVSRHVIFGRDVFLLGWMGHPVPEEDLNDWRGIGRRIVSMCLHYFFGDWRQNFLYYDDQGYGAVPCDLPRSRTRLPWLDAYCLGLALALCLGDEAATDRLLEWPGRDLGFDEGYSDKTRADNAYQIWLASRLRGEPAEMRPTCSSRPLAQSGNARNCWQRRPRPCWRAIPPGSRAPSPPICGIIVTSELKPRLVTTAMSDEGTALWHLAMLGTRGGEIPADLMLMIPRP